MQVSLILSLLTAAFASTDVIPSLKELATRVDTAKWIEEQKIQLAQRRTVAVKSFERAVSGLHLRTAVLESLANGGIHEADSFFIEALSCARTSCARDRYTSIFAKMPDHHLQLAKVTDQRHRRTILAAYFLAGAYNRDFGELNYFQSVIENFDEATATDLEGSASVILGIYFASSHPEDKYYRNLRLSEEIITALHKPPPDGDDRAIGEVERYEKFARLVFQTPQDREFYEVFFKELPVLEDVKVFEDFLKKKKGDVERIMRAILTLAGAYNRDFGRYRAWSAVLMLLGVKGPGASALLLRDLGVHEEIIQKALAPIATSLDKVQAVAKDAILHKQSEFVYKKYFASMPLLDVKFFRSSLKGLEGLPGLQMKELLNSRLVPYIALAGAYNRDYGNPSDWFSMLEILGLFGDGGQKILKIYNEQFKNARSLLQYLGIKESQISRTIKNPISLQNKIQELVKGPQSVKFYRSRIPMRVPIIDVPAVAAAITKLDGKERQTVKLAISLAIGYVRDHGSALERDNLLSSLRQLSKSNELGAPYGTQWLQQIFKNPTSTVSVD
jgi:hypothetical protein